MRKWVILIVTIFLATMADAETIKLKSGKVVEGKIVERTDDKIKVDVGIGVIITYYSDDIASIDIETHSKSEEIAGDNFNDFKASSKDFSNMSLKELAEAMGSCPPKPEDNKYYNENGNLAFEGIMKKGKILCEYWDGTLWEYDSEGKVIQETRFKEGKILDVDGELLNGEFVFYAPKTGAHEIFQVKNGVYHGISKLYIKDGTLISEYEWKNGVIDGSRKMYDKDGNLVYEAIHDKNGQPIKVIFSTLK